MNTNQLLLTNNPNTNETLKPEAKQPSRRGWGRILLLTSTSLGAAIVLIALHLLSPNIPGRAETFPARVGWYLAHGQWWPDSRTLAAAWEYFLQSEIEMPTEVTVTDGPVAATPTETLPRS